MIICFNGVDGSGKSFQANRLVERLNNAGYPAVYVWSGGHSSLTLPIIRIGKRVLKGPRKSQLVKAADSDVREQYRTYSASMQRIFKNSFVRGAWRQLSLLEHTIEIWRLMLPHVLRNKIVVCDRYIYDTVISVALLSGTTPQQLPRLLRIPPIYRVPQPKKWFFMDVPAIVAFQRKDDILDPEFIECRVPLYKAAAATLGMQVIDGTADPDAITAMIWQSVQPLLPAKPAAALQ